MANEATNYLERRILDYIFKGNALSFSSPGNNLHVGLATAVATAETGALTEANFTNYAGQNVAASGWTTIGSDSTDTQTAKNAANIEFPASGGGGDDTITHAFIADASSSGNILFVGALSSSRTIAEGDIFRINANNLTITLS